MRPSANETFKAICLGLRCRLARSQAASEGDLIVIITGVTAVPEQASWLLAGLGLGVVGRRVRKQSRPMLA